MVSNIFNALVLSRYCLPNMSHGGEFFSNKIILNLILATLFSVRIWEQVWIIILEREVVSIFIN